jgi:K+-transporting ATPase ATPase C chain
MILSEIRSAVLVTITLAVVTCGLYPGIVLAISQTLFRDKANGSLIVDAAGTVRGSRLIGQQFSGEKYFHSRPSAAGNGYDATSSGGSNLGPSSQKLHDNVAQAITDYRSQNGLATNAPVPADAVTSSGSGLDPHISPENAQLQAVRVSKARGLALDQVSRLIVQYTDRPAFGILGDSGVRVLELNLALDAMTAATPANFQAQPSR